MWMENNNSRVVWTADIVRTPEQQEIIDFQEAFDNAPLFASVVAEQIILIETNNLETPGSLIPMSNKGFGPWNR